MEELIPADFGKREMERMKEKKAVFVGKIEKVKFVLGIRLK